MIVSKQRSGTTHFVSLLDSHPQIACYGEVFRDGYNAIELMGQKFAEYQPFETRTSAADQFLDDLETHLEGEVDALGFKVFPKQFMAAPQIANRADMRVIRLVRPNLLAIYSSNRIAKVTGQGSAYVTDKVRRGKVAFDPEDFDKFTTLLNSWDDQVNEALKIIPKDRIFDMEYTDLNSETVLENILAFLGVKPRPMTSEYQKRNPSRIVERFDNPDTVMAYLEQHGRIGWAEE